MVVTHLSPTRESKLAELLERFTDLPVLLAANDTEVLVDSIYVLGADAILGIENGRLRVRDHPAGHRERKPIDIFFSALAKDRGEFAAGVVLSGGDGDGTLGIKAIKEHGGLTLAQVDDDFGPEHPDMPQSAIATGLVDFAVPANEMGSKLVEFARNMGTIDSPQSDGLETPDEQSSEETTAEFYTLLRNRTGHDFSGYKPKTFMRRVQRRMQVTQLGTADAYVERLRQDQQEVTALFRDLLINVTSFFRDEEAFESLATLVVPKLFEGKSARDTVRVWIPGCSTGEEVFSVAMLLREHMDTIAELPRVQIFATDIDEHALTAARAGRFPETLLEAITPARRKRFFVADGASAVVSKDVRELCVFSPHSVFRDPPFSRIDLVSCRNLLIYFGADIQSQVLPLFHYALRPDGYLFLGSAENVSNFTELFVPLEKRHRLFRRRSALEPGVRVPTVFTSVRPGGARDKVSAGRPAAAAALRQVAESHMMERHVPPHVLVNGDGDIVHFSSRTGRYLEAPAGTPTRQIVTIARKGLRLDLRSLFREVLETGRASARTGIVVETDDGNVQMVGLKIEPLGPGKGGTEPLYLVLFFDEGPLLTQDESASRSLTPDGATAQIERELRETRERLQATVEEYETALEELKSSNEELVSVNEEQQSTNEELEASKEELQSVNEELQTVNTELTGKIEALDQANSDLRNLFESTEVATVFLDGSLVIRSFTPAVARIFNILPSDRGRPITDLSSRFVLPDFVRDIELVVSGQESIERRAGNADGSETYLVRLAPYRNGEGHAWGVVVTFVDVTGLIRAERQLQVLIAELQHRTRNLLALVQSLARRSFGKSDELETFLTRLSALGRVQGLIGNADAERVNLRDIVVLEVQALGAVVQGRVTITGRDVSLPREHVHTLVLALHELATNAVKHGALKEETGALDVSWTVENGKDEANTLVLVWRESGLSTPPDSTRSGFGRYLIEHALTHTMHAKTEFTFGQNGLTCRIGIPLGTG